MSEPVMSTENLNTLISQGSSLHDRLALPGSGPGPTAVPTSSRRLDRWKQVMADNDNERFLTRLQASGLTEGVARRLLDDSLATPPAAEPHWAKTLYACLNANADPRTKEWSVPGVSLALPVGAILRPFLFVAWRKLEAAAGLSRARLTVQAQGALLQGLLDALTELSLQVFNIEFSLFCALHPVPTPEKNGTASQAELEEFVSRMSGPGFMAFYQRYPALARLAATTVDYWVETTVELLHRLNDDWCDLAAHFDSPIQQVIAIRPRLSDPHNGQRSVHRLDFDTGLCLYYKPRSGGMEMAFAQFIAWINRQGPSLALAAMTLLDRPAYCWTKAVEHRPCDTEEKAKNYHRRTGMLLAILYVLHGTDVHHENLIAHGEQPLIIDLETLFAPRFLGASAERNAQPAAKHSSPPDPWPHSVLSTCLLPSWTKDPDGTVINVGGLWCAEDERPGALASRTSEGPAKGMRPGATELPRETRNNVPVFNGQRLSASLYEADVVHGFEEMYRLLMARKADLLEPEGPLSVFRNRRLRVVCRPTSAYVALLEKAQGAKYLRSGVERGIELEAVARAIPSTAALPAHWPLFNEEIRSLDQFDIPYFCADTSFDGIYSPSGAMLRGCFGETPFERVRSRIVALSEGDCARQISLCRVAVSIAVRKPEQDPPTQRPPLSAKEKVAWATGIAHILQEHAVRRPDGSRWLGLGHVRGQRRYEVREMDQGLYSGSAGIALFFAAVWKVTGNAAFRDEALAALKPLLHSFAETPTSPAALADEGIGMASGLGANVFSLVRIGQLLGDPSLLDAARRLVTAWNTRQIAADTHLDVMRGSAGAILGLLALHDATADPLSLERACQCADHLLNHRTVAGRGQQAWMTNGARPQTGFSHGASGMAYALSKVAERTANPAFLEAAREAVAYERSVFSPERGDWPFFWNATDDPNGQGGFQVSWCYGASGIGLARLAMLTGLDEPGIREDLETAIRTTQTARPADVQHLCCGTLGRLDFLLEASRRLGRADLRDYAERGLAPVLQRTMSPAGLQFLPYQRKGQYIPGLFQGLAGLGYSLLRFADPESFPSLLLFRVCPRRPATSPTSPQR